MTSGLMALKHTKLGDAHRLKNQLLKAARPAEQKEEEHPFMIFLLWFAAFSQLLQGNPLIPVPSMV